MFQNATSQAPMTVFLKHSLIKVCQVLLWIPSIIRKEPFIWFKKDRKIVYHIKKKRIHDGFCKKKEFRAESSWFSVGALPVEVEDGRSKKNFWIWADGWNQKVLIGKWSNKSNFPSSLYNTVQNIKCYMQSQKNNFLHFVIYLLLFLLII